MPKRSPALRLEDSVPEPREATVPAPSWPPTWPAWVGWGRMRHFMLDWASDTRVVMSRGDCLRLVVEEVAKDRSLLGAIWGERDQGSTYRVGHNT
jgi:hypothetical protein